MAVLPGSLALMTISDGALATAADLRNNFTAIQTENNSLLTILGAGTAGDVFTGVGTTVQFAKPTGYEYGYTEITATVNVVSTTEATPTTIVTAPAVTLDGSTAIWVEFYASQVVTPSVLAGFTSITLFEGATEITRMGSLLTPAAAIMVAPVTVRRKITPTAGAHTYSICAHTSSTTGTPRVIAGAGSGAADPPAYIRISKA